MTHLFYKDAAGCLIVYDQSRFSTLNGAAKWKDDFDTKVNYDPNNPIPCVLVGNKVNIHFIEKKNRIISYYSRI
jgi:GTPase SAR1 family protein